jgi:hypothetical protein
MVKPPIVFIAGMLRGRARGISFPDWTWIAEGTGQRLYYPPDVAGWDDRLWLDTNTTLGRWQAVRTALRGDTLDPGSSTYPAESPEQAVAAVRAFWGGPSLSSACVDELTAFAGRAVAAGVTTPRLHAQRQNALRQLLAASPDYQTS